MRYYFVRLVVIVDAFGVEVDYYYVFVDDDSIVHVALQTVGPVCANIVVRVHLVRLVDFAAA